MFFPLVWTYIIMLLDPTDGAISTVSHIQPLYTFAKQCEASHSCVLSPFLFDLLTHDCNPKHSSNLFIQIVDSRVVMGLISNRQEKLQK